MPNYRRIFIPNAMYFFTVNLEIRANNDLLIQHIDVLRYAIKKVKKRYPFEIVAWVVLPEHMHCIWQLPEGDANYSTRWRLIKTYFTKIVSKHYPYQIWQKHFWEHMIRNEKDLENHLDYIHYNPVKHNWVSSVQEWKYSTFHNFVQKGIYPLDWGGGNPNFICRYD